MQSNQSYNWQHLVNHRKGKRVPENICFCFIDYTEAFDCVSSVQSLSHVRLFVTPWTAARQASLFIINYRSLPKAMSIESVMPSNHRILCHPLLLLLSIFPSIRSFQMSQLFASAGQTIGVTASASVLPMNTQDWSPLGWTGWISLQREIWLCGSQQSVENS